MPTHDDMTRVAHDEFARVSKENALLRAERPMRLLRTVLAGLLICVTIAAAWALFAIATAQITP